jgi:hypothetical protein
MEAVKNKFCKRGHKYQFFPGGRCMICYRYYHNLRCILKNIKKYKDFMYLKWVKDLQNKYDFGYYVASEGMQDGEGRRGKLADLYKKAEDLI